MANTTRNMEGRALIRPWLNVRGQSKPNPGLVMLGRVVAPFVNSMSAFKCTRKKTRTSFYFILNGWLISVVWRGSTHWSVFNPHASACSIRCENVGC